MSGAKHTPGPWGYDGAFDVVMQDDVGAWIACVNFEHVDEEQAVADARLIAAAPDMLAALKAADAHFTGTFSEGGTDHQRIRAAIAKAEDAQ